MDSFAFSYLESSARAGRAILGRSHYQNEEWHPLLEPASKYLKVLDISYAQASNVEEALEYKSTDSSTVQSVEDALAGLAVQKVSDIRVYVEENLAADDAYRQHVAGVTNQQFADEYESPSSSSIRRLQSQCRASQVGDWWSSEVLHLVVGARQDGLPVSSKSSGAYLIRTSMRICCVGREDGRVVVFISCISSLSPSMYLPHKQSVLESLRQSFKVQVVSVHLLTMKITSSTSQDTLPYSNALGLQVLEKVCKDITTSTLDLEELTPINTGTDVIKQILLLRLCHTALTRYSNLLDDVEALSRHSDPMPNLMTEPFVQAMKQEANLHELLRGSLSDANAATEFLLQILSLKFKAIDQLQATAISLRALSSDNHRRTLRLSEHLDTRVKFVTLRQSVGDALRSWLISILASIFLPLSLACGILSMQTRLRELHYLLYDFCGLLVLFGTFAILILMGARAYGVFRESIARADQVPAFRRLRPFIEVCLGQFALAAWALMTASFLYGMIDDVGFGLRLLGYGEAAAVGLTLIFVLLIVVILKIRKRYQETAV